LHETLAFEDYGVILNYNTILLSEQSKANVMFKLKRTLRPRIPNTLAAAAALTLVATSLLGTPGNTERGASESALIESQRAAPTSWVTRNASAEEAPVRQPKRTAGFRVNLFLFRHH
jgi:hypothetical protein